MLSVFVAKPSYSVAATAYWANVRLYLDVLTAHWSSNTAVRASDFCAKLCKASCCKPFYVLTLFGQHVLTTTQQTSIVLQQVCDLMQRS